MPVLHQRTPRSLTAALLLALAVLVASLLPAVAGEAAAAGTAQVRLGSAIVGLDSSANYYFFVDGVPSSPASSPAIVPYTTLEAGSRRIQVAPRNGDPATASLVDAKVYVASGKRYTLMLRGVAGSSAGLLLIEDRRPRYQAGFSRVRFSNFAPDVSSVDIYANGTRIVRCLGYRGTSAFIELPLGTNTIEFAHTDGPVFARQQIVLEYPEYIGFAWGLRSGGAEPFEFRYFISRNFSGDL